MERFYLTNETVAKNHCQINKKKQKKTVKLECNRA